MKNYIQQFDTFLNEDKKRDEEFEKLVENAKDNPSGKDPKESKRSWQIMSRQLPLALPLSMARHGCMNGFRKELAEMLGGLKAGGVPGEVVEQIHEAYNEFEYKMLEILGE